MEFQSIAVNKPIGPSLAEQGQSYAGVFYQNLASQRLQAENGSNMTDQANWEVC